MKTENLPYKAWIAEELAKRTERNPRYSLRAMARAIGIEASALSEILSVKRIPSFKVAKKIIQNLNLSPEQGEFFLRSIVRHRQQKGLSIPKELRVLASQGNFPVDLQAQKPRDLSSDYFRVMSDWYHYAILMLTYTEDFQSNPKWIAAELSISEIEAKLAIERLIELELLRKDKNGKLVCWSGHFTTSDKSTTSAALKRRQKQVLEKSAQSIDNDPLEERSHTAMTMAIDSSKIPEAKKLIEEFTNKMSAFLETGKRDRVYEIHIGLFPMQKKKI